jgi:hypothetical protein
MAKRNTSNYKPAAARAKTVSGRRFHLPHPHLRREFVILGGLAVVVVLAAAALGGAMIIAKADHDWASVASINGHNISREALRPRLTVIKFLAGEQYAYASTKASGGAITSEQLPGLQAAPAAVLADPVNAARESLIDDELIRQLAAREGVATPANPDPWAEARAYASADLAHQIRIVRFSLPTSTAGAGSTPAAGSNPWPAAAQANVAAATERLRKELTSGVAVETIVAGLHDAGWVVYGENVAVSETGVPADSSLQLDPEIAAGAETARFDQLLGPATDEYGRVSMALSLPPTDPIAFGRTMAAHAESAKVDTAALQDWANGRALRRALAAALLERRKSKGVTTAHFREVVIGDAITSSGSAGPWVRLAGLALDQLARVSPGSIAGAPAGLDLHGDALAKTLRSLSAPDRTKLFSALVAAANSAGGPSGSGSSETSGELGFRAKGALIPDVGKAAFDAGVKPGDILGPIKTSSGPQLFLVEDRFAGSLDERAVAALSQLQADAAPDPLTYTTRWSPADAALARDAGRRADAEFGADEDVRAALFDTPLGKLSGPFVLDGKLACAIVEARQTGAPTARTLARLTLDSFDAWYHTERTKATITRSDNPLPELMPSPSPSPTRALPTMPGLATPALPTIPGQPRATPVKTDELGLPALP